MAQPPMPADSIASPLTVFLQQLDSPAFQDALRAQLRAEAAAANTFLSYRDAQGRYVHEYPATGEVYEVSLTQPQTRRLLPPHVAQEPMNKERISDTADGSRTAHLQPVIDFLKAQGNEPATGDAFYYNRDGYGVYGFAEPLDMDALRARFDFPASIVAGQSGVYDSRNFVSITQDFGPQPVRPLSFE